MSIAVDQIRRIKVLCAVLLALDIFTRAAGSPALPVVRQIEVEGNLRFGPQTVLSMLSEARGKRFSAMQVRQDLERLFRSGLFQNVEVESSDVAPGFVDLVYRVRERPFVSSFSLVGLNDALADQAVRTLRRENLDIRPGIPFRPERARKAADVVRHLIQERRHPQAEVDVTGERRGSQVRVTLEVRQGPRIELGAVRFVGAGSISREDLLRRMGNSRPASLLTKWTGAGRYLPDELRTNLEAVRSLYLSRGYAGVNIGKPEVVTLASPERRSPLTPWNSRAPLKIAISVPVVEGPAYTIRAVHVEGRTGAAASEISKIVGSLRTPRTYDYGLLESTRVSIQEALGRHGYALARVEFVQSYDAEVPVIEATYRVEAGETVRIRRIDFTGNLRLPDRFLRRELRVTEGETYNSSRLDESIRRLNRSGLVEELRRDDVTVRQTPDRRAVDLAFKVRERGRHGVYGTGGTGGLTGGYLGAICTAFNLLGLGERLSFELDGGSAQSNALLNLAMDHFMGGPFSLGFSLAHRLTGLNASSIVPGPRQVMSFLRVRSSGGAVQGAYRIGSRAGVGLGLQVAKETVLPTDSDTSPGSGDAPPRLTLQPSFSFDSTGGTARTDRGVQILLAQAWSAPFPLKSADTGQQSARLRIYHPDPFSGDRNGLAFQVVALKTRPLGAGGLPVERRLYPADEILRGFAHGAVSPWSFDPNVSDPGRQLQPAGADTVLGASSEYRVPIYGPASGVVFADFGWIGLRQGDVVPPATIVAKTNSLLRISTGGELRVLVPGLHQPARLIFAWNPLRLNALFARGSGAVKLAEPARSIRFALGNVF